jgi:hypothetical protein
MVRIFLLFVLLCFGCQTGRIPCPKFKGAKQQKRYRNYSASLTAKLEEKETEKTVRPAEKYVRNVDVEEWDCPQPGAKKYLPKKVRDNIRRNARKINDDLAKNARDSVAIE